MYLFFMLPKDQPLYAKIASLYCIYSRFGDNDSLKLVLIAAAHDSD